MGYTLKHTRNENEEDFFDVGEVVLLPSSAVGEVVMKIGHLYQVKREDGVIRSYTKDELKKRSSSC